MRTPPSAAGVHGANDIFPGFFRGEKFEKNSSLTSRRTVIFKKSCMWVSEYFHFGLPYLIMQDRDILYCVFLHRIE